MDRREKLSLICLQDLVASRDQAWFDGIEPCPVCLQSWLTGHVGQLLRGFTSERLFCVFACFIACLFVCLFVCLVVSLLLCRNILPRWVGKRHRLRSNQEKRALQSTCKGTAYFSEFAWESESFKTHRAPLHYKLGCFPVWLF